MNQKNIEDIYPLSPMQQGMLFHYIFEPEKAVYVEQLAVELEGEFDISAFRNAWTQIIQRHSVFRTAFVWEDLEEPLQVVNKQVALPLEEHHWESLPAKQHLQKLQEFMRSDRESGFDLLKAPLMRLHLIHRGNHQYYFVWTYHHMIIDGWGVPLVFKELFLLYEAFRQGKTPQLPPVRPYRDYIAYIKSQDLQKAENFWKEYLKDLQEPTPIPVLDLPGRESGDNDYLKVVRFLPESLSASLNDLARKQKVTLSTIIQTAYGLLLQHYSGEPDVVFGVTVSGRPPELQGVENMVGLFINTLPLRLQFSPTMPITTVMQTVQQNLAQMRQYEYTPLVQIQGWTNVPRSLPLFQSILVFENYPVDESLQQQQQLLSLRLRKIEGHERTNYPLTLVGAPGKQIRLEAAVEARRLDQATTERLLDHLVHILEQIAQNPEQPLEAIVPLTEGEFEELYVTGNASEAPFPEDKTLADWFEEQAVATPDAPAVVFTDLNQREVWSYRQLNETANRIAHYLQAQGVGADAIVGICAERSPVMLAGLLGILKAGAAYLPLDPDYPLERLQYMVADSGISVLLQTAQTQSVLPDFSGQRLNIDDAEALSAFPTENPGRQTGPNNLAYVIYTSGSTGRPKGTLLEHRGVVNILDYFIKTFHIQTGSPVLSFASFSFDAAVPELFTALMAGGTTVMAPRELLMAPQTLGEILHAEKIYFAVLPPSLLKLTRDEAWQYPVHLISAGEACPLEAAIALGSKVHFYNGYGPTEATVGTTLYPVDVEEVKRLQTVPIGRPMQNYKVYVVDAQGRPCPVGVPGELWIASVGLARGYLKREDLTAEKFIPNPFGKKPSDRVYRSGDRVRMLPNGTLEFLGRIDDQVKLRGFRIEIPEIEAVIKEHPGVKDAVVALRTDGGTEYLAAYLIPESNEIDSAELREFLKSRLPEFMIPAAFVTMDAFPLLPNGKVNRRNLPAREGFVVQREYVAPRTPQEEVVAGIFADILNLEKVGALDNFFELGGHSLLATQLVSRLRDAFQVEIPLKELFENPTVEGIARRVQEAQAAEAGMQAPPIEPIPRDGELPLSFAQQRLWFLDQLQPGSAFYNIPMALRIKGNLQYDAMNQTIAEIIQRHEVLRTTFENVEGKPRVVIHPPEPVTVPITDLQDLPEAERETRARELAKAEAQAPFDLAKGPLFRVQLLKLAEDDHIALVTMHHIISDGWSMAIFVREVGLLYPKYIKGNGQVLPELKIQYVDYAAWQRKWLQGEVLQRQLDFWKRHLEGAPPVLELPTDKPRPAIQTFNGTVARMAIPSEVLQHVRALSKKENATVFMTVLAAFYVLLHRYSGQDDIVVGTPIAGRSRSELENLIGFFVNTLALRARFTPNITFKELLRQVRETTLGAHAHQDLPFEQLVEELQPERNLSHSPIFQVMFVFQNLPLERLELPGITLQPFEAKPDIAKFDLSLIASEGPDGLMMEWEYNTDLFTEATIRRMMSHFETLLKEALAQPDVPVARLPLLSDEERHRMLVEWNATRKPFDESLCVHQKFEQVAATHPQAIAVELDDQRLTYQELNARANQLAHYLRKQGVGPEVLVGISMDRSIEMVVSMLGVLKAGGAFVPIDPTYPPERVQYMIEDSGIPVLLTQKMVREFLTVPDRVQVIAVDEAWETIAQEPTENPENVTVPENLAYVIYTSGSTGRPKGTLLAHRGLINLAQAQQEAFHITPESRVLQFAALSFDASVWEFVMALLNGATLVLAHREQLVTGQGLEEVLRTKEISIVTLPPSVLAVMPESELPALRTIVLAGEKVTGDLVEKWGKGRQFVDAYGPTETTVCASMHVCEGSYPMGPPIGRGINNFELYVLDEHLELVPVGVPGELYIGGPGLARGYLGRPDLTAERFVPHPFSRVGGERLYRTGDLVRWLPQGELEFLGRVDFQVKVRGFRIELGEIEAVLSEHPHIADAAVVAVEDGKGNKRLVGYIVPTGEINIGEVKEYLRKKLPDYMVPSVLMVLEEMPLTPSGKVDRRRLPKPSVDREALGTEYVAPRNETEEKLAAIVGELLEIEKVGVYDNFFDLGGHSLLATQFIARIRKEFDVELPLRTIFEKMTVSEIATEIEQLKAQGQTAVDMPKIKRVAREARRVKRGDLGKSDTSQGENK